MFSRWPSMDITCLGTGSATGNCYLIKTDGSSIILDAGVSYNKILRYFNMNDVSFAFISHNHNDHSKEMKKIVSAGVQVIDGGITDKWQKHKINKNFRGNCYTFGVKHDTTCNGLIIETREDTILYLTDLKVCKPNLSMFQFTSLIIECNYVEDNVTQEMIDSDPKIKRQINTHLGLKGLEILLDTLNLTKCKEIILIHQSTDTRLFDEYKVKMHIFGKYLIPTGIAQPRGGIDWIGNEEEFEIE